MPPGSIDPKKIPPGPGFQATGSYGVGYVVLRSYEEPPRLPPPDTRVVHDLLRQLGDDDVARREDAQQKLLGLGEASIPELREALRSTQDVEVRVRIDQLFRAYERQWLGPGPIPDWWTPDVRKE